MDSNKYYTSIKSMDGFGAQYQRIIQTFIYCKINNMDFAYDTFKYVEHNYSNDNEYNNKLENLINLKDNLLNVNEDMNCEYLDYGTIVMSFFENNIDTCCECEYMSFIKDCFWKNKTRPFFNNNKLNVAVHIRRDNSVDNGRAGERVTTPNSYYLNVMNLIREKYNNKDILFHIYSQGNLNNFEDLVGNDVLFYLDHDIIESFLGMVAANVLVTSPSSLSYVAALISDGEIYYKPFWHKPRKHWIICNN
jgi:hypothetical protein